MLNIGPTELLVVLVLALIVFGPNKLPEFGRSLGRGLREFRRASDEIRGEIQGALNLDGDDERPTFEEAQTPEDEPEIAPIPEVPSQHTTSDGPEAVASGDDERHEAVD